MNSCIILALFLQALLFRSAYNDHLDKTQHNQLKAWQQTMVFN